MLALLWVMATKIDLTVPAVPVQNADVQFQVRRNGGLLGTLKISKGGLDWYRKNARKRTGTCTWEEFRVWMES